MTLSVDETTCILCNKCVKICTSKIFHKSEGAQPSIELQHPEYCISCGHCVAVCPTSSVSHSDFPKETIHPIHSDLLPRPEQVLTLIRSRRSNRAFSGKAVPEELLQQIVEAAYRAPTASNEQELEFTLVTDPEKLHLVSSLTLQYFGSLIRLIKPIQGIAKKIAPKEVSMIPQFEEMERQFHEGNDLILRGAKALLLIHTHKKARFGRQDANLAYQNASLMAESLGVAHFYTGFVCTGTDNDKKQKIAKALGIEGSIQAGMAMGMPSFRFERYIDRKPIKLNRV
ncbi:nitroreductase family protein [Bacteroidales bacterium OttesenSCG-928-L03]|nr:nitroreductase family protein [Bacteroidales bacterium OttesenSCG-928-L03]